MVAYLSDTEARAFAHGERVLLRPTRAFSNPYMLGTSIDLKETWAWDDLYDKYIWKADLSLPFAESQMPPIIHWRSPVTMPAAAVRWHMTVTNVEAVEKDGWWWKITMEERRGND